MARLPFSIPLSGQIASDGTLTVSYQVPTNQELEVHNMVHVSDGAFSIIDIYDSEGTRYTNATQSNGIPNTLLKDGADDYHGINPFAEILNLKGGRTLYINLFDTSSGANDVAIVLNCVLIKP